MSLGTLEYFIEIWQKCKMTNSWKLGFQPFSLILIQPMTYLWLAKAHNISHFMFHGPWCLLEWKMQKLPKVAKTPTLFDQMELRAKLLSMTLWSNLAQKMHKRLNNARTNHLILCTLHFWPKFPILPSNGFEVTFPLLCSSINSI